MELREGIPRARRISGTEGRNPQSQEGSLELRERVPRARRDPWKSGEEFPEPGGIENPVTNPGLGIRLHAPDAGNEFAQGAKK